MKITYTVAEAIVVLTKAVTNALGGGNVTIEILPDVQPVGSVQHQLAAYARMLNAYGDSRLTHDKISAIKVLRAEPAFMYNSVNGASTLGLRDAKYIIESPVRDVLNYFVIHQTLMGFSDGK